MIRFRRKSRLPGQGAAGSQQAPVPSARVMRVGREPDGVNPYDANPYDPGSAPPTDTQRLNARPARTRSGDPYGTADRAARRRSWDDAFIDTWVEHE